MLVQLADTAASGSAFVQILGKNTKPCIIAMHFEAYVSVFFCDKLQVCTLNWQHGCQGDECLIEMKN